MRAIEPPQPQCQRFRVHLSSLSRPPLPSRAHATHARSILVCAVRQHSADTLSGWLPSVADPSCSTGSNPPSERSGTGRLCRRRPGRALVLSEGALGLARGVTGSTRGGRTLWLSRRPDGKDVRAPSAVSLRGEPPALRPSGLVNIACPCAMVESAAASA